MSASISTPFRAGLAALIGRTNVGKSTTMNALVGRKVSIVTPKPQTTRHVVHGVVHGPNCQLVLVDTPGFFRTKSSKLVTELHRKARAALEGIDLVVHMVDPTRELGEEDEMALDILRAVSQPRVLCLNKLDVRHQPAREAWRARACEYAAKVEISALHETDLDALKTVLFGLLPEHPPFYPAEEFTNAHRDFQIAELIREQVYELTGQEVPYRTAVELDAITEAVTRAGEPILEIKAAILTSNERYQRMLIGVGARKIREIGTAARRELEQRLGRKVFLDLDVLVDRHVGE